MAYDEELARRVRSALEHQPDLAERPLFGGLAFLVRGNLCCGVVGRELMVRVGPRGYDEALRERYARPMDFTRRPLRGLVYVEGPGIAGDAALRGWVDRGARYAASLPPK